MEKKMVYNILGLCDCFPHDGSNKEYCLIWGGMNSREAAEKTLTRMLTNPTEADLFNMRNVINNDYIIVGGVLEEQWWTD